MIRYFCCICAGAMLLTAGVTSLAQDAIIEAQRIELNSDGDQRIILEGNDAGGVLMRLVDDSEGPWFGVHAMPVPDFLADQLGLEQGKGLVVRQIRKDSSAEKAGILKHDILLKADETELNDPAQLWELMRQHKVGDELSVELIRKGQKQQVKVKLQLRKDDGVARAANKEIVPFLGVRSIPVTPALTDQLNLPEGEGALVLDVLDGSAAAEAGLRKHDIVQKIDDTVIKTGLEMRDAIRSHKPGDEVVITVLRGGDTIGIKAVLGERVVDIANDPLAGAIPIDPQMMELIPDRPMRVMPLQNEPADMHRLREEQQRRIEEMRKRIKEMMEQNREGLRIEPGELQLDMPPIELKPGQHRNVSVSTRVDKEHVITLTRKDESKHVVAKDREGNVLFDGPINTADEIEAMPEDIREKVEQMDKPVKELRDQADPNKSNKRRQGVA